MLSFLATLWLPGKINRAENQKIDSSMQYPKGDLNPHSCNSQRILSPSCLPFHHSGSLGAKNGTRTRDPNLGKVVLYQLSYFRECVCKDRMLFGFCKIMTRKSISLCAFGGKLATITGELCGVPIYGWVSDR